jgi:hypothetical protein
MKTKTKLIPNIERLRGTLEAVNADLEHFNPKLWVSAPDSKKYPETCGDFAWFGVQKYGTKKQKAKFTWDKAHIWVGRDIFNLSPNKTDALFWGGLTLGEIVKLIYKWEKELENESA